MKISDLAHSDYIVYVDESGDHSLVSIDEGYPVFVLSFCIFQKEYYSHVVTPKLRMLKFSTFGHDMVILHEHDIRKKLGAFSPLGKEQREIFLEALNSLVSEMNFTLIATVIDKYKIKRQAPNETHAYHLAMQLGLPAAELNLQISIKSYLILHRYSCQWKIQEKIFPNK